MSARLDGVAGTERRTIPVPYGHHVYVLSDLSLSPTTQLTSRPVQEFLDLLGDIDDAAIVVVAGNLFHPDPTSDLAKFIEATFDALPEVREAFLEFCATARHQLIVLAGSDDAELKDNERARAILNGLGICVASDLVLQVATATGVRDLAVAAGTYDLDVTPVDQRDLADADRLDDPHAIKRFVASRVLYRRLAAWVWLPLVVFAGIDLWSFFAAIAGHFTGRHYRVHLLNTSNFWVNVFVIVIMIALAETAVAGLAGLIVRGRFNRIADTHSDIASEPLTLTKVDEVDALEFARRIVERGGVGAIVGGAPSASLAFLGDGVSATPGPSRTVLGSDADDSVCRRSSPRWSDWVSSRSKPRARCR